MRRSPANTRPVRLASRACWCRSTRPNLSSVAAQPIPSANVAIPAAGMPISSTSIPIPAAGGFPPASPAMPPALLPPSAMPPARPTAPQGAPPQRGVPAAAGPRPCSPRRPDPDSITVCVSQPAGSDWPFGAAGRRFDLSRRAAQGGPIHRQRSGRVADSNRRRRATARLATRRYGQSSRGKRQGFADQSAAIAGRDRRQLLHVDDAAHRRFRRQRRPAADG